MNEYEGLFILDTEQSSAGVDGIISELGELIGASDGKVLNAPEEQKLDRRAFARVANKKHTGGFYLHVQFEMEPGKLDEFRTALSKRGDVFRAQITHAIVSAKEEEAAKA